MPPKIGVLALQGAFAEHVAMVGRLGAEAVEVRMPSQLRSIHGLIIPGGESTTMSLLMSEYKLTQPLKEMAQQRFPIMGTCAGLVLLSRLAEESYPDTLKVMDVQVRRNAFGRQVDSFEANLDVPALGNQPFRGIFIRAPRISNVGPSVNVLCQLGKEEAVAVRQGNILCCSFHPELGTDTRFHQYFLDIVAGPA